mmetsp:Transcript_28972/g.56695  ORF Transcript_28972/g.56695 Transcript_28972/m.56695 type:complete len:163 (-) Transcript_28972:303-791(-)
MDWLVGSVCWSLFSLFSPRRCERVSVCIHSFTHSQVSIQTPAEEGGDDWKKRDTETKRFFVREKQRGNAKGRRGERVRDVCLALLLRVSLLFVALGGKAEFEDSRLSSFTLSACPLFLSLLSISCRHDSSSLPSFFPSFPRTKFAPFFVPDSPLDRVPSSIP